MPTCHTDCSPCGDFSSSFPLCPEPSLQQLGLGLGLDWSDLFANCLCCCCWKTRKMSSTENALANFLSFPSLFYGSTKRICVVKPSSTLKKTLSLPSSSSSSSSWHCITSSRSPPLCSPKLVSLSLPFPALRSTFNPSFPLFLPPSF